VSTFPKASVRDAPADTRRALVRVDFNVPLAGGAVEDDTRIRAALPTIELLRERGTALVLVSHLDRPKGFDPALSMAPVAGRLADLLAADVSLAAGVVGDAVQNAAGRLGDGEVLVLENSRFEPGETRNDPELAAELTGLAELYVNDAFGAAHRAHATTEGVAHLMPAYAGLLLEREVQELTAVRDDPDRPLVVILGGAKVSDKIGVIERFLEVADEILIGGAMCFSFFRAEGVPTGDSLVEEEGAELARRVLARARRSGRQLRLPVDLVIAEALDAGAELREVDGVEIPDGWMGVDIGPRTAEDYATAVRRAGTVFWNGPMGAFECEPFASGTRAVAEAVAAAPGRTVVGGGDSVAALSAFGLADQVDWLSTGGGASLELMEGRPLPGVEALMDATEVAGTAPPPDAGASERQGQ
jgi:phosphoglycerate kinase